MNLKAKQLVLPNCFENLSRDVIFFLKKINLFKKVLENQPIDF